MNAPVSWPAGYEALIARLPELAANARLTIGGFSACVDVYVALKEVAEPLRAAAAGTPAQALLDELERRAGLGLGGEIAVDWPEGAAWMARHVSGPRAIGGTSAQAATMLAMLGAPALVALRDRSAAQLAVMHDDILLATEDGRMRRAAVELSGDAKPPHYIFEFTAGQTVAGRTVPRSSRVIVRFDHKALERDPFFERASIAAAGEAGAGIICGFNEIDPADGDAEIAYAADLARRWRDNGLALVHLELGDFDDLTVRQRTIEWMLPAVTSVGMSLSELAALMPDIPPAEAALQFGERFDLMRMCVHADAWAMAATRGDPGQELEALQAGCLLASARAAAGTFAVPDRLPDNVRFTDPPPAHSHRREDWSIVCCPAPYLDKPAATIGLGDTFLAGTLLVLGGRPRNAADAAAPVKTSPSRSIEEPS